MALATLTDVHVPAAVIDGLRRRSLDVRTAQADGSGTLPDEELLGRATALGRVLLTQDVDFLEIAARWQASRISFTGILFAPQGTSIGRLIDDAALCLVGLDAAEIAGLVVHLPLR